MNPTATFRALHQSPGQPLVLPNVWDAGGARLVESLGAKAVATTSAGVAWSLGYADGNRLPIDLLAHLVRGLVAAVRVPVTIDVEGGYASDPAAVADRLAPLFEAGIAGINIEDGADAPDLLAMKVESIRSRLDASGQDVFVNVRTDVYLRQLVPDADKVRETLSRAAIYRSAGADGLFVPGIASPDAIAAVAAGATLPLNVMAVPGLPARPALAGLGVRRLSAGSAMSQAMWHQVARLTERFLATGDSGLFGADSMAYGQLQALFADAR